MAKHLRLYLYLPERIAYQLFGNFESAAEGEALKRFRNAGLMLCSIEEICEYMLFVILVPFLKTKINNSKENKKKDFEQKNLMAVAQTAVTGLRQKLCIPKKRRHNNTATDVLFLWQDSLTEPNSLEGGFEFRVFLLLFRLIPKAISGSGLKGIYSHLSQEYYHLSVCNDFDWNANYAYGLFNVTHYPLLHNTAPIL